MRRLLKPFFSRIIPGIMLLVIQLMLLVMPIAELYASAMHIDVIINVLSVILILFEINRDTDSGYKLIWIAIIGIFPLFGSVLYVYVQSDVIMLYIRKKLDKIKGKDKKQPIETDALSRLKEEYPDEHGIFSYLCNSSHLPCFTGGKVHYFSIGEEMYRDLLAVLKNARKYIFLEYFIINENDEMWQSIYSILKDKVKEGVEVRVIYDSLGSLTCTSSDFASRLNRQGIKCYPFSPLKPFISTYHNNRNHKKTAIIDGKYAYTGGINIADEYINKKVRFGHWKDTAIRVEGDAVYGFLLMYSKIWNMVSKDNTAAHIIESDCVSDGSYISVFDDSPLDADYVSRNLYVYIINTARDYVYINTPYLILDDALSGALKFAAMRGVDVRICMPHIPDKWYAFVVGRSYYPELLRAGVKIYEYTPGFLHAKSTVSDDSRAYVGSANYDFRSLYLHYECGVYMYKNEVIKSIKEDFESTVSLSQEITMEDYKNFGIVHRVVGKILRFFASVM